VATFLVAALGMIYYFWKNPALDQYGSRTIPSVLGLLIPLMVLLPLITQFFCSVDKIIKIYVAPKYFLIDLILNLKNK